MFNNTKYKSSEDLVLRIIPSITMGEDKDSKDDVEGNIKLAVKPKTKIPPLYRVLMMNDDYTPMEFVVYAIQKVFGYEHERATQIMLSVHTKGKGVCGIFPKEIAEMNCAEMNNLAQINEHPLLTEIEPMTD